MPVDWRFRFLVASPRVQDLLFSAKYLFVAASRAGSAMGLPREGQPGRPAHAGLRTVCAPQTGALTRPITPLAALNQRWSASLANHLGQLSFVIVVAPRLSRASIAERPAAWRRKLRLRAADAER
jgi:hypothetical protein